jgi:anti-anti-sigma factor
MDNKLDIWQDAPGREQRVFLDGRLDASGAGHLEDYLNSLIREGSHRIILNMSKVKYLSSAGIRILVGQYKQLKKIGGLFVLEALSESVLEVLTMVGLVKLFTEGSSEHVHEEKEESGSMVIGKYRFGNEIISDETMTISLTGDPRLALNSGFTAGDSHKIKFSENSYGIGIGAIGDGFDDCKSRYGEFIAVGEALIYKPSDGSKIPDYAIKKGRFEPEINALVSLQAKGSFSKRISFEPVELNHSISLEELTDILSQTTGYRKFVFLMIAESSGIVGMSLNSPPVGNNLLFEFPAIREKVNFTTEPAYSKMLTVSVGFYSIEPEEEMKRYLRPVCSGSSVFIHTHTAVFPFQALSKSEPYAGKLVLNLLESSIVQDVLHLIHDSREISGLGDSTFKQGVAWVGKIS